MCMKEKPYITPTWMDNEKNEWWDVERQFFLKFKNEFQKFGFMPVGRSFIKEQF